MRKHYIYNIDYYFITNTVELVRQFSIYLAETVFVCVFELSSHI